MVKANNQRRGEVINLDSVVRLVQLVPRFGSRVHDSLDAANSADIWPSYFLNDFLDKQMYQVIH